MLPITNLGAIPPRYLRCLSDILGSWICDSVLLSPFFVYYRSAPHRCAFTARSCHCFPPRHTMPTGSYLLSEVAILALMPNTSFHPMVGRSFLGSQLRRRRPRPLATTCMLLFRSVWPTDTAPTSFAFTGHSLATSNFAESDSWYA